MGQSGARTVHDNAERWWARREDRAFAHPTKLLLLRRDLAWGGRRIGEVGDKLRMARLGVADRLLLDRAVAADEIGQRQQLDRGLDRHRREMRESLRDILFI